jgi:hypothetical protein
MRKLLGLRRPRRGLSHVREEEDGLAKGIGFGSRISRARVGSIKSAHAWWLVCAAAMVVALSGCTYNPGLGKWKIDQRTKETYESYVDPLSSHIKKHTGNDTIELLKDSIVVSGGGKDIVETGIEYRIQELEEGGTEVKIYQPRKDQPGQYDIDLFRVSSDGKSAHLETPSEIVELKRIE